MINLQLYYDNLPEKTHQYFSRILEKEIEKLDKYLKNYPPIDLKINASQTKTSLFEVKAILSINSHIITTTKEDRTLRTVIESISDVLKENLMQYLEKDKSHR